LIQFLVTEDGTPATNVRWSVNGIPTGDRATGTITAGGLYTAPVAVPVPSTIMIAATHLADPANAASATVTILPPLLAFVEAPLVSLTLATSPASSHIVTAAVSVALADVHAANLVAALTSVAVEPIVSAVAPLSGMPGTVTALTVAGRGLAGATALTFLRDNAADASVTATNLSVSPDGNRVIADVTIASGAPSGARVVRVVTPDGTSTAAGTGGNVFTIPSGGPSDADLDRARRRECRAGVAPGARPVQQRQHRRPRRAESVGAPHADASGQRCLQFHDGEHPRRRDPPLHAQRHEHAGDHPRS